MGAGPPGSPCRGSLALSQLALKVSPSTPPVAQMQNLSMRWGETIVLDRVDLSLMPGERLVVVGPSGAGK